MAINKRLAGIVKETGNAPAVIHTEGTPSEPEQPFIAKNRLLPDVIGGIVELTGLAATKAVGASMSATVSYATDKTSKLAGTELGWTVGETIVNGGYVSVEYVNANGVDMSADNYLLEFSALFPQIQNRLRVYFSSSTSSLSNTHDVQYQSIKFLERNHLTFRQSDMTVTNTGCNFADVKRLVFRFYAGSTNNKLAGAVILHRLYYGFKTKPRVLLTFDDNCNRIYDAFKRVMQSRNIKSDIFCTNYEIPSGDLLFHDKCNQSQNDEMAAAGWRFYAHQYEHRPYAVGFGVHSGSCYSRTGDTVTLNVEDPGGGVGIGAIGGLAAGDSITIEESSATPLNGTWTLTSATENPTSDTWTLVFNITTGAPEFSNRTITDGGTVTINKYDFAYDIKRVQALLKRSGLPTDDAYMAYTYGGNSKTVREKLASEGVRLARSTTGGGTQAQPSLTKGILQIYPKFGLDGLSSKLLSIETLGITDSNNLSVVQTYVDRLKLVGGVLSLYTHIDTDITDENIDPVLNYLADERDAGNIELIQMHDLDVLLKSRTV